MNTPSPLIPQGSIPPKGKSTFFFKVLMILTVHVVLIGGMLLQGCKDTKDTSSTTSTDTAAPTADTLPPVTSTSNNTAATPPPAQPQNPAPVTQPTAVTSAPPVVPVTQPVVVTPPVTAPATTEAREYVIAAGDTLGAIAHKNGISLKALMAANAGVDPKKLQIGQKIQIPAAANATTPAAGASTDMAATGDATVYTVKSGDTLGKIAKMNHTTVKKIMALNDLKTTSIKVAQKLKLPTTKMAEETPATPASTAPIVPLQTPPASTSTAAAPTTTSSN